MDLSIENQGSKGLAKWKVKYKETRIKGNFTCFERSINTSPCNK